MTSKMRAYLCEHLSGALEFVPLAERIGNLVIRVLIWHHDHTVQFMPQDMPPLHCRFDVRFGHCLPRRLPVGLLSRVGPSGKAHEEAVVCAFVDNRKRCKAACCARPDARARLQ